MHGISERRMVNWGHEVEGGLGISRQSSEDSHATTGRLATCLYILSLYLAFHL